jgi:sugar lactone lactonase YvrE
MDTCANIPNTNPALLRKINPDLSCSAQLVPGTRLLVSNSDDQGLYKAVSFGDQVSGFGNNVDEITVQPVTGRLFALGHTSDPNAVGAMERDGGNSIRFFKGTDPDSNFDAMEFEPLSKSLFVADSGKKKILKYDIANGAVVGSFCDFSSAMRGPANIGNLKLSKNGKFAVFSLNFLNGNGELWSCFEGSNSFLLTSLSISSISSFEFSVDETVLFVSVSKHSVQDRNTQILRLGFSFSGDMKGAKILESKVLTNFKDLDGTGNSEISSMRIDSSGDLWLTRNGEGRVDEVSSVTGALVRSVSLSLLYPASLSFGGYDGKLIFVVGRCGAHPFGTGNGCIDVFRTDRPGKTYNGNTHVDPSPPKLTPNPTSPEVTKNPPTDELNLPSPQGLYKSVPFGNGQSGFGTFIEGAVVSSKTGRVYAVNHRGTDNQRNDAAKKGTVGYLSRDAVTSSLLLDLEAQGSQFNGLQFDPISGDLIAADYGTHKLLILDPENGNVKGVFCDLSSLTTIQTPNDLTLTSDGQLAFLSGMDWAKGVGELWACFKGGNPISLSKSLSSSSNGVQLSMDEKFVFVSQAKTGTGSPNSHILKIGIEVSRASKTVQVVSRDVLIDFNSADKSGGVEVDGMRIDAKGDLWAVRNGGGRVDRISTSTGTVLQSVKLNMLYPTNIAFGGHDGTLVYVVGRCGSAAYATGDGCIEVFRTDAPGRQFLISLPKAN